MKLRPCVPLFATVAFLASILVGLALVAQHADIPFDGNVWRNSPDQRTRMIKSLLGGPLRPGQSREAIEQLLGEPDSTRPQPNGAECLLYRVGSSGIDDLWLEVEVKDALASRVTVRSD
ncbi:MAG: hypothetical protein U0836_22420 [Pirellulales bacterium]